MGVHWLKGSVLSTMKNALETSGKEKNKICI